jgi:hypothetical protein
MSIEQNVLTSPLRKPNRLDLRLWLTKEAAARAHSDALAQVRKISECMRRSL